MIRINAKNILDKRFFGKDVIKWTWFGLNEKIIIIIIIIIILPINYVMFVQT